MRVLFLFCLLALCSGCTAMVIGGAAAAGAGAYTYVSGQLVGVYNANLTQTYSAAQKTCVQLRLPLYDQQKGLSQARIKSADLEKEVWIVLKSKTSTTTEVSVRVGYIGDEEASRRIHEALGKNLR